MRGLALAVLVAAVIAASLQWGTFVAGGSDSYCYLHQAQRWADVLGRPLAGGLQVPEPLALEAPWPDAPLTFTPVGHVPSPTVPGAIAPMCPSGYSIAMAPFVLVAGAAGAFAVGPMFGALLVLATYVAGSRLGARVGMAGAALVAASPVFLYQVVQPMSDVPAAALWMLAVAAATGTTRRHALWSGLATSAAILVRPNLLPLGAAIGLFLLVRPERTWPQRARAAATYAAASAIGCAGVALVQQTFYGSPLSSGYGSLDLLFGLEHVEPNLRSYLAWLWQTHTPAIALALLAPALLPGALTALFAVLIAINLGLYLPYVAFDDWSYLRFLLPTIPLLLILAVAAIDAAWRRVVATGRQADLTTFAKATVVRRSLRRRRKVGLYASHDLPAAGGSEARRGRPSGRPGAVLALVTVVLAVLFVREAEDRNVFRLQALESRFARAGRFVRDRLPPNALVITASHSGSVRFYANRKTLAWDALDPAWLERAITFIEARGYEPYLLFETREEPAFRQRFGETALGRLDWPPAAEIAAQVRLYRPGDRERYLQGTAPPTVYVR